jgi:sugar/nucleoside kinase (ribokinase family)
LNELANDRCDLSCGGSAVNSLVAYTLAGGQTCSLIRIGNDKYGVRFRQDLEEMGILVFADTDASNPTGHSIIFTDPSVGRMMATCLGAANSCPNQQLLDSFISSCDALLLEGYMLAIESSLPLESYCRQYRAGKITSCCISAPWIAHRFRKRVLDAIAHSSIVFANEEEATALTGVEDAKANVSHLANLMSSPQNERDGQPPLVVVTAGADGAFVGNCSGVSHVPAIPTNVVDSTGAGDAFVGAFLFSYLRQADPVSAANGATAFASEAISTIGARVSKETAERWRSRWVS